MVPSDSLLVDECTVLRGNVKVHVIPSHSMSVVLNTASRGNVEVLLSRPTSTYVHMLLLNAALEGRRGQ